MNDKVPDQVTLRVVGAVLTGLLVFPLLIGLGLAWQQLGLGLFQQGNQSRQSASATAGSDTTQSRAAVQALLDPTEIGADLHFSQLNLSAPQALCACFAPADQPQALWHLSSLSKAQWECYASFGPQQEAIEEKSTASLGEAYKVFIILRGTETRLQSLRLKLSLYDVTSTSTGLAHFRVVYDAVMAGLGLHLPPVFENAFGKSDWSQFVSSDYVATWSREYGEPPRYDLEIEFASSTGKFLKIADER